MNILPKKRWHVKNKDNAARVESDELKHRKKLKDDTIRSLVATQEARLDYLRRKSHGSGSSKAITIGTEETIRLFADVEENRTLRVSNPEYEEEKRKEIEAHEKQLGILKCLSDTVDGTPAIKPWWSLVPEKRKSDDQKLEEDRNICDEVDLKRKHRSDPLYQMKRVEDDFARIREAKEQQEAKERAAAAQMMSSCTSFFPNDIKTPQSCPRRSTPATTENEGDQQQKTTKTTAEENQTRLEKLRAARLAREHAERERAAVVLCKSLGLSSAIREKLAAEEEAQRRVDERQMPFNSAFNPELSNLAKERRTAYRSEKRRRRG